MAAPTTGTPTANSTWRLDVDTSGSAGTGSWIQVKGMSNFVPGKNDTVADASDYDTDGWGADAVMQQKFVLNGTVRRNKYAGSRDAGQELLRAHADSLEMLHVRWYERTAGGEAYEGWILVQWTPNGGDAAGIEEANIVGLGQGPRTAITSPFGTSEVPVVSSVSPSSGALAGGELVTISGAGFTGVTGATGVKFGANNADSYTIVSDSKIVAVAPAGTAGAKDVVVTNATGPSTTGTGAYTYA